MIDIKQQLVNTLKVANLPVYYENLYKDGAIPAITYIEVDDADLYLGTKHNYSTLRYEVKVWGNLNQVIAASLAIDTAMKAQGWTRYAAFETNYNENIIKVLRYVATGYNEV